MAGHAPYYSHRTMWRTAVNVFNETKKSGVNLDFKTYQAIMQSLTVHTRKNDSSGVKLRPKRPHPEKKPVTVNISAVPSLGLWKPLRKSHDAKPTLGPSLTDAKSPSLSLGEAPRPIKPRSLIAELQDSQAKEKPTPMIFEGAPYVKKPDMRSSHTESVERVFSQPSADETQNLSLNIPGIVKLIQSRKHKFFSLQPQEETEAKPEPAASSPYAAEDFESANLSVVDIGGVAETHVATPVMDIPRVIDPIPEPIPDARVDASFVEKPFDRQLSSLSTEGLPEDEPMSLASEPKTIMEETQAAPDIQDLTSQWERRREEEAKEQERLAEIEFAKEETRRQMEELRIRNDDWVERRGSSLSLVVQRPSVSSTTYDAEFNPRDDSVWSAFNEAKASNSLTAEHVRVLLRRFSARYQQDSLARALAEVQNLPIEGIEAPLMYHNLLLQYQTGVHSRVTDIFTEMERNRLHVNRRCVTLAMLSSVRCDPAAGWQRATELYTKYKPIIHDPLCLMELNMIQSLSQSNMCSLEVRTKVLESLRNIHGQLRESMNQIGKMHSTALIRAYVKLGDTNTAQSILKGFQNSGEADQAMYASIMSSCPSETIQEIVSTFLDGNEVIESDLLAAVMFAYVKRKLIHEAWATLGKAKANQAFEIRGSRLGYAVLFCVEAEEHSSESHVMEAHDVLLRSGNYSDQTFRRIVPYFQKYEMDNALIEAVQSIKQVYHKNIAPAHIAAYQQACKAVQMECVHTQAETFDEGISSLGVTPEAIKHSESPTEPTVAPSADLTADFDQKLMHLAKCGDWQGATSIVTEMGQRRMKLSTFQYNCVLTAAKGHGSVVDDTLKHMADFHVKPNTMTINLAMNAYARIGSWDQVQMVYDSSEASTRDLTTYHLALGVFGTVSEGWRKSIKVFNEIRQRNLRPTQQTFNVMLNNTSTCSWTHALRILQLAYATKGVEISTEQKDTLVKEMVRRDVQNAVELVQSTKAGKKKGKGKK